MILFALFIQASISCDPSSYAKWNNMDNLEDAKDCEVFSKVFAGIRDRAITNLKTVTEKRLDRDTDGKFFYSINFLLCSLIWKKKLFYIVFFL